MYLWITEDLCITERWGDGWLIKYRGEDPVLPEAYVLIGIGVGADLNCNPPRYTRLVYRKDERRMQRRELENVLKEEN